MPNYDLVRKPDAVIKFIGIQSMLIINIKKCYISILHRVKSRKRYTQLIKVSLIQQEVL